MTIPKAQLKWIASVFLGVVILDQVTKTVIRITVDQGRPVVKDVFFQFVHHGNRGMIGGSFSNIPIVAFIAPVVALVILLYLYRHLNPRSKWQSCAYGMILGGAIGNMIDRAIFREVTDFLQFNFLFIPFEFPWKMYPAFNVADSAVFTGVGLLLLTWNMGANDDATDTA